MARYELTMPKLGESIMEATIIKWVKNVGDKIEEDETLLEIATDKVDSEVPSPVSGIIQQILFEKDAVVPIGHAIAIIETEAAAATSATAPAAAAPATSATPPAPATTAPAVPAAAAPAQSDDRFYSPLVRSIAKEQGIAANELASIAGSGQSGRVNKTDILGYIESRSNGHQSAAPVAALVAPTAAAPAATPAAAPAAAPTKVVTSSATTVASGDNVEIIEMDRMRRLIADHMVMSVQTSPHVTSFVEADVTTMVMWRNKHKGDFQKKYGENITFTPLFIEAVTRAIGDFPLINSSVDGYNIIRKKDINIGMAAALPSGNLIVPVIKNADQLNLAGLAKQVNGLANRARLNQLKPDDVQGGTFTVTNVGTFGNVMGTPIINQPQVAIMALGAIRKRPAVIETPEGDVIAIRHMMFISLSYDHRVVDGMLGGSFLRKVADYLEQFDGSRAF
jgi:2-oxoglutarate dehydrogenase E2 component (dihydrolipoamide succinyltransferase)